MLPIKVNIRYWKIGLDSLPTRCDLNVRGIDIGSTHCPICDDDQEFTKHLLEWGMRLTSTTNQTTLWAIWYYTNRVCFDLISLRKDTLDE